MKDEKGRPMTYWGGLERPAQKSYAQSWDDTHPKKPAQEPVAWNEEEFNAIAYAYRTCPVHEVKMVNERYQELVDYVLSIAHPHQWQGLSINEEDNFIQQCYMVKTESEAHQLVLDIEQALKEKNT
jgi:hypothetical protein